MKKIHTLIALLFCFAFSFQSEAQTTINDTLVIDGLSRNYILYQPAIYDGSIAVPLVINMHGYGSNSVQQMFYGDFKPLADVDNFIVVCPNGTLDGSGSRYWNAFVNGGATDDVSFISQLIDSLSVTYNIDQSKVFATGMSNGGFMSYKLACELTNKIAKIASVTGTMNPGLTATCSPSSSIPVMEIHGTSDQTVPYNGIPNVMEPIADVVDFWVNHNNCDLSPTITAIPDNDPNDNSTAERIVYANGDNNSEVIHYKVIGGGHTWPDAIIDIPGSSTNHDFNASTAIWTFFKGEPFVGIKDRINADELNITIQNELLTANLGNHDKIETVRVVNTLGQEVLTSGEAQFSIRNLNKGLYYVLVETPKGFISQAFMK
jgi:polyhydroxybutyrate depolymerase